MYKIISLLLFILFLSCQNNSQNSTADANNKLEKINRERDENSLNWEQIKKRARKGNLTFTEYLSIIPKANLPVKYSDYDSLFLKRKVSNSELNVKINKEKISSLQKVFASSLKFEDIKKALSNDLEIIDSDQYYMNKNGKEGKLGFTCPVFVIKNEKYALIGYLSEWLICAPGSDFYEARSEINLVTYNYNGGLIKENIHTASGSPLYCLFSCLPTPEGYMEQRSIINEDMTIITEEILTSCFEIKNSENSLDEELVEIDPPLVISNVIGHNISTRGVISERLK